MTRLSASYCCQFPGCENPALTEGPRSYFTYMLDGPLGRLEPACELHAQYAKSGNPAYPTWKALNREPVSGDRRL